MYTYIEHTSERFQVQRREKNQMEGPRQKSSMKDEGGPEQCTFLEEIKEKNYDRSDEK